ncbi:MAG TPA: hypothetical protein VF719_09030 [Abditibacteriaceae bacterium]|jgi:hypothetical protein
MRILKYTCLFTLLLTAHTASAQTKFNYLDDEAEEGGYDVTATLQKSPAELTLAENDEGEGYRLKITPDSLQLGLFAGAKLRPLATVSTKLAPGAITVQRRGPRWSVLSGGKTVLQAEDDKWHEGKVGFLGGLKDVRVQPIEEIKFADDFMRDAKAVKVSDAKTEETLWRSVAGTWSTSGLSENVEAQVSQSANPFAFKASAKGANLALAGRAFWSDYTAEVSVKPQGATAIGLAAYAQDDKNYLLFYWPHSGPMQLRAVVNGQTRVLDEAQPLAGESGGFEQRQWYRLRFSVASGTLRGYVDDTEVLRARTGLFGRGEVGLFVQTENTEQSAFFDDVAVRSEANFYDDFAIGVPGRWQTVTGGWKMQGAAAPADARGAFAVMGENVWSDYTVSASVTLPADSAAGLVLHHRAGEGALWLRFAGSKAKLPYAGRAQIVRLKGGKTEVLGESSIGSRFDGKTTDWRFSSERGYLKAEAADKRIIDAFDDARDAGRAGMSAQNGMGSTPRIANFAVEFIRARPTWAKVPDLFEEERQAQTMGGWSTPQGFWLAENDRTGAAIEATTATSAAKGTLWHKGRFWGDDSVRFPLPAIPTGQSLDLMFAEASRGGTSNSAAAASALKLNLRMEGGALKAGLARGSKTLGSGSTKLEGAPEAQIIEVSRRGTFVIVRNGSKDGEMKTLLAARAG